MSSPCPRLINLSSYACYPILFDFPRILQGHQSYPVCCQPRSLAKLLFPRISICSSLSYLISPHTSKNLSEPSICPHVLFCLCLVSSFPRPNAATSFTLSFTPQSSIIWLDPPEKTLCLRSPITSMGLFSVLIYWILSLLRLLSVLETPSSLIILLLLFF